MNLTRYHGVFAPNHPFAKYASALRRILSNAGGTIRDHPQVWASTVVALNSYPPPRLPEARPRSADTSARGQPVVPTTADHVRASGEAQGAIDHDDITVTLIVDEGYHVNANPASFDYLIPTQLVLAGLSNLRVTYPDATEIKPNFAPDGLKVYQGRVNLRVAAPKGTVGPGKPAAGNLMVQVCNEESCLPPATLPVTIEFVQ